MGNISLKNINKSYDGKTYSVKDFNLEIEEGEFIVLVGPSGCGKSTTLRMIAGLEEITEGDLFIDGQRMNDVFPKDRNLAMVFQSYALYPHMKVYDNLAYPLKLRKEDKNVIQSKVEEVSKMLGLEDYLDKKPGELSGGQKQRVALGRCMVRDASAFLMDEPLSNLDAKLRSQMRAEITKLHEDLGKTFVYVTHDQVEAMTMADRIVVMKDGFIQQIGRPEELYKNPENKFVAGFLGSPSMNFIDLSFMKLEGFSPSFERAYLGFRPEKIRQDNSESGLNFKAKVSFVEPLGAESYVRLDLNGCPVLYRDMENRTYDLGKTYDFSVAEEDLYYFDIDDGSRLREDK